MEVFATSLIFLCIFLDEPSVSVSSLRLHTLSSSLPRTLPNDVYLSGKRGRKGGLNGKGMEGERRRVCGAKG